MKRRSSRGTVRAWVASPVGLAGMLLCVASSTPAGTKQAVFGQVVVVPFTIEAVPFRGASERSDKENVLRHLSEEATARAERTLLKRRLAAGIERAVAPAAAGGALVLTGTVQLPVSIPSSQQGGTAMFRRGLFALATVAIRRPDGALVAEGQSRLAWRHVRWLRGGRSRRSRALDSVLADAVRKAVDHAVERLARSQGVLRQVPAEVQPGRVRPDPSKNSNELPSEPETGEAVNWARRNRW